MTQSLLRPLRIFKLPVVSATGYVPLFLTPCALGTGFFTIYGTVPLCFFVLSFSVETFPSRTCAVILLLAYDEVGRFVQSFYTVIFFPLFFELFSVSFYIRKPWVTLTKLGVRYVAVNALLYYHLHVLLCMKATVSCYLCFTEYVTLITDCLKVLPRALYHRL